VHQSRRMELVFGARGTVDLELAVYGPIKGLHDGHYGNWVPNPIVHLTHLIDSMRDESGRILIKGFYDDVREPTAIEKEALARIPNVEGDLRREFQIGATEGNGKPLNELLMLPSLNLHGAPVIPRRARRSTFRFPVSSLPSWPPLVTNQSAYQLRAEACRWIFFSKATTRP